METLVVARLDKSLPLPRYQTAGSSGLDLHSAETVMLLPGQFTRIRSGLQVVIPDGNEGQVRGRSGIDGKGWLVREGTIDHDYRGELCIQVANASDEPWLIRHGDRIAQFVVSPVTRCAVHEAEAIEASTDRGCGGFGSTGMR